MVAFQSIHALGPANLWLVGYNLGNGKITIDLQDTSLQINWSSRTMGMDMTNSSISDSVGNILFYTNGIFVANAMDDTLDGSSGFNPGTYTTNWAQTGLPISQGSIILPYPGHPNEYYLFHESAEALSTSVQPLSLCYSVVDMNLNNGLGKMTQKNITILNDTLYFGELTAVKHANGRDWWLVSHRYQSDVFFTFLISKDSIIGPYIQNIGSVLQYGSDGQCAFSPDGRLFSRYSMSGNLDVLNFDRCTGVFFNWKHLFINDSTQCGGVCFSPNSKMLYVASQRYMYQFNTDSSDFINHPNLIGIWDGFASPPLSPTTFYKMMLSENGRIYGICPNGTDYIHIIYSPNDTGTSCNLTQHAIQLPVWNSFSMPNYPFYNLGAEGGTICDSLPTEIATIDKRMDEYSVFPNPTTNELYVNFGNEKIESALVFNSLGQIVSISSDLIKSEYLHFNVSGLENGFYYIELLTEKQKIVRTFVKQ